MKQKSLFAALLTLALVASLIFACNSPAPVSRSGENTKIFFSQGGDALTVASGGEIEVQSGGTLDVQGTLSNGGGTFTIADAASVTGVSSLGDKATFSGEVVYGATPVTLTAGLTVNPASSYYVVSSSAAVSMTLGTTGATAGQLVFLYGDDANTVTVNDTNILTTDGNAVTFGQYDIVGFLFNGTSWVHLWKSANQ
jgi:hypothetical protein